MEKSRAIELLKLAVPIKALTQQEYSDFVEAVNMGIDALEQPEIVWCCECIHFQCNMRFDGYVPKGADAYECRRGYGGCDPMDYCSYGERAERRSDG